MPQRQRPSLSAPSYGAYTGRINWSRGMDERLAAGTSYAPPVQAASTATPTAPTQTAQQAWTANKQYWLKQRANSLF